MKVGLLLVVVVVVVGGILSLDVAGADKPYIGMPCSNNFDCDVQSTLMACASPSGQSVFTCTCQQFLAAVKYSVTHPKFDTKENKCVVKKRDTCKMGRDGSTVIPCQASTLCALNKDETDIGTCVSGAARIFPISIFGALFFWKIFTGNLTPNSV